MKKHLFTIYILLSVTVLTVLPVLSVHQAQSQTTNTSGYTLLEQSFDAGNHSPDLGSYLQNLFYILLGLAGVASIVQIVRGGLMYMTPDSIGGKAEGKKLIWGAIQGLILAIASALILKEINPTILNFTLFKN